MLILHDIETGLTDSNESDKALDILSNEKWNHTCYNFGFFLVITTNITINKQKGFSSSHPYISSEEALDTLSNVKWNHKHHINVKNASKNCCS